MQMMTLAALLMACNYGLETTVEGSDKDPAVLELTGVDGDADGVPTPTDCDDEDATVYPGAPEICDDQDNDCDGLVDDEDEEDIDASSLRPYYVDEDGDGVGSGWLGMRCSTPPRGSLLGTDCDDSDASNYPDAPEICDDQDNDCDGLVDDADDNLDAELATTWFFDADGDGEGQSDQQVRQCKPMDGYVRGGSDCDDTNASIYPGADELCDAIDNDCDGLVDDDDADLTGDGSRFWFGDRDGDGHGSAIDILGACSQPDGYVDSDDDCDDTDPTRYEGAPEICDGKDNNCDAATGFLVDEEDPAVDLSTVGIFFADRDGDGRGDGSSQIVQCTPPEDAVDNTDDCDDGNPFVWGGAPEVCDGIDNNCDGTVDDADPLLDFSTGSAYWIDADGDGFGVDGEMLVACVAPQGSASVDGDCDDTNPLAWTDAPERCDGVDNNCDGVVDAGLGDAGEVYYVDADGDGFGDPAQGVSGCEQPQGTVTQAGDCNDEDAQIFEGAPERCDGVDNDCDGLIDGADTVDDSDGQTLYLDLDGDGFGDAARPVPACETPAGAVDNGEDCDDDEPLAWSGAMEACDGVDNNCDGLVDDADPAVDMSTARELWRDADGDGFGADGPAVRVCEATADMVSRAGDCDDGDARVWSGAVEICDGVDNDCNGAIDDDDAGLDATTAGTFFVDLDEDGSGDPEAVVTACVQPLRSSDVAGDCDDGDPAVFEGAPEVCDGADNDCDGLLDDADDLDFFEGPTLYADADGDGYGDPTQPVRACANTAGAVANDGDCDDGEALAWSGAPEVCDGVDNDCREGIDDADPNLRPDGLQPFFMDGDGDGFGVGPAGYACEVPDGAVEVAGDCDDAAAATHPDARELCDGVDNNCDQRVDGPDAWWDEAYAYRIPLMVDAPAYPTLAPPVSIDVDFDAYLASVGDFTGLDVGSVRVIRQDCAAGQPEVPSEFVDGLSGLFERGERTDPQGDGFGSLTFLYDEDGDLDTRDVLPAGRSVLFAVYFGSADTASSVDTADYETALMVGRVGGQVRVANAYSAMSMDEVAGGLVDSFGPVGTMANLGSQVASTSGNGVYLDQPGGGSSDAGWLSAADADDGVLQVLHAGPMVAVVRASGSVEGVLGGFAYEYTYMMLAGRPEMYASVRFVATQASSIGPVGAFWGSAVRPYQVDNIDLVNQSSVSGGRAARNHRWVRGAYSRASGESVGVVMGYRAAPSTPALGTASTATGRYLGLAGVDAVDTGVAQQGVSEGTVLVDDAFVSIYPHVGSLESVMQDAASSVAELTAVLGPVEAIR